MGRVVGIAVMLMLLSALGLPVAEARNGCGNCPKAAVAGQDEREIAFRRNTIDLRQELMNKRFELQRENLKATPDKARMDALQGEISALQKKIFSLRTQSGLKECLNDGDCIPGGCGCGGQKAKSGCGTPCDRK